MSNSSIPRWLEWAREIQALAQSGESFSMNRWQSQRYQRLMEIAAEIISEHTQHPIEPIKDSFKVQAGYATLKVDVRGAVFQDDKLLMVRERLDNAWTMPGGWADVTDSPSEAVEREIREESGFEAKAVKLLAVFDREKHPHHPSYPFHIYKMFFLCKIVGGSATPSTETEAVEFFSESEIPPLSLTRVTPGQIARFFEHHRNPDWPTDFD